MSGLSTTEKRAINEWYLALPHHGIPKEDFDRIKAVGDGITMPLYGRGLLPHHVRWLYDHGLTEPAQIHDAVSRIPHPHAPNVSIGDYPDYVHAHQEYEQHSK